MRLYKWFAFCQVSCKRYHYDNSNATNQHKHAGGRDSPQRCSVGHPTEGNNGSRLRIGFKTLEHYLVKLMCRDQREHLQYVQTVYQADRSVDNNPRTKLI